MRIVGVLLNGSWDAAAWCKELKPLPCFNLTVMFSLVFHKVFNKPVEKTTLTMQTFPLKR
jgi:hypothetical protein